MFFTSAYLVHIIIHLIRGTPPTIVCDLYTLLFFNSYNTNST